MKTTIVSIITSFMLMGCGVSTSGNINIDPGKIRYTYDHRTNLCFAVVASRKAMEFDTSGFGLTNVPCNDAVMTLAGR